MRLYNDDHQAVVVTHDELAVQPGDPYDFTDEQIAAGVAGKWSEQPPRAESKADLIARAEDAGIDVPPRATKADLEALLQQPSEEAENTEPAPPADDDKEQQA